MSDPSSRAAHADNDSRRGPRPAAYFPFCFFNLLSPVLDVLYGFIGFKVPESTERWADLEPATSTPGPSDASTGVADE